MKAESKKILVTGGCGFIGSHTVVELIENGYNPVIVDSLENSELFILHNLEKLTGNKIPFYHINCCNKSEMEKIFSENNFQGVIHFAAYKSVNESVKNPLKYYDNNINTLTVVLDLCQKFNVSNFIFSSSCTVYGQSTSVMVTESTSVGKAESPYGTTKIICENIISDFTKSNISFKPIILRYFNPIGAHPSSLIGELPLGIPNNLIPYITQTAAGKREKLTVNGNDYSTTDGTCVRDYIHVCDLAKAHVLSLSKISSIHNFPEIFNLGTGKGISVLEVITEFEKISKNKLNYEIGPRRSGDVEAIFANNEKAKKDLGWNCKYNLSDALLHSWNWENNYSSQKKSS